MKRYIEGHWFMDKARYVMQYVAPGEYEEGIEPSPSCGIDASLLPSLFRAARDDGMRLVNSSGDDNAEYLKIIYKLLDIIAVKRLN